MKLSVKKYRWNVSEVINSDLITQLLHNRNIEHDLLKKTLKDYWPQTEDLPDLHKAINMIIYAVENHIKIGIVGDYDADGTSSTAILVSYFTQLHNLFTSTINSSLQMDFIYAIPNRFVDGYGISKRILEDFVHKGVKMIITVDHGTTAYEAIDFIKTQNIQLIVIDHHSLQKPIEIDAFINPHRIENSIYTNLCATALVFIFVVELNKMLFQQGIIKEKLNVKQYLDLAAVATVCDVMPLTKFNRVLLLEGLHKLNNTPSICFKLLLHNSNRIPHKVDVYRIGFHIGPYLNAPGRFGKGEQTVEFLITNNEESAKLPLLSMLTLNVQRRQLDTELVDLCNNYIEDLNGFLFAAGEDWHEGVLGIVAGRLKDKYYKPICVLTIIPQHNIAKGSLRSVPGFHIGKAIKEGIILGVIKYGGGHEFAGGLTIDLDKLEDLKEFFRSYMTRNPITHELVLNIDAILSISAINHQTYEKIHTIAPFGAGAPEPIFMFPNCYIKNFTIINHKHCVFQIASSNMHHTTSTIVFDIMNTPFHILMRKNLLVHIAASMQLAHNRNKIQIQLQDIIVVD